MLVKGFSRTEYWDYYELSPETVDYEGEEEKGRRRKYTLFAVLETEGLSPGGERHSVTLGDQL